MKRILLQAALIGALALTATSARASVVYLETAFATKAPEVGLVVDTTTGDVKIVGTAGAEMSQYRIISASGALLYDPWISVGTMKASGVTGLDNYVYWMPMFKTLADPGSGDDHCLTMGDKCCPARDNFATGRIIFDNVAGYTLDLGEIYDTTKPEDLVFTYSYGYVTDPSVNTVSHQVMGGGTYPKPAGLVDSLPAGDAVSAFGLVTAVPEPATLSILGLAGVGLFLRRRRTGHAA